jgi:Pvc16 N-terminal domain
VIAVSHFSVVRDASLALRQLLFDAANSDVDFGIDNQATQITLNPPDEDVGDDALLSVYLYHISPDASLRNQPQLPVGTAGLIKPPLSLRLSYLITPLLGTEALSQMLLGRVMQSLHDQPLITMLGGQPLDDSLGGGSPAIRVWMEPLALEELTRIWHALGTSYRLSLAYQLRVVLIDSTLPPRAADRVVASHLSLEKKEG